MSHTSNPRTEVYREILATFDARRQMCQTSDCAAKGFIWDIFMAAARHCLDHGKGNTIAPTVLSEAAKRETPKITQESLEWWGHKQRDKGYSLLPYSPPKRLEAQLDIKGISHDWVMPHALAPHWIENQVYDVTKKYTIPVVYMRRPEASYSGRVYSNKTAVDEQTHNAAQGFLNERAAAATEVRNLAEKELLKQLCDLNPDGVQDIYFNWNNPMAVHDVLHGMLSSICPDDINHFLAYRQNSFLRDAHPEEQQHLKDYGCDIQHMAFLDQEIQAQYLNEVLRNTLDLDRKGWQPAVSTVRKIFAQVGLDENGAGQPNRKANRTPVTTPLCAIPQPRTPHA